MKSILVITTSICLFFLTIVSCAKSDGSYKPIPKPLPNPVFEMNFDTDIESDDVKKMLAVKYVSLDEGKGYKGGNALKVAYVGKKDLGSERVVERFALPGSYKEATLTFQVKFDYGFLFVLGGKLHGLGPVNQVTGGDPMTPDGWSARINFNTNGGLKSYLYVQDKDSQYGRVTVAKNFNFTPGQWYNMAIYVKVNYPETMKNGISDIYVNGELLVHDDALDFRSTGGKSSEINRFLFSTFHGGTGDQYAPKHPSGDYATIYAWFDNFKVYPGRIVLNK